MPAPRKRSTRSATSASVPTSEVASTISSGIASKAPALSPLLEAPLDLVGDLAEAEAVGEVDVEVRLAAAHAAEVEDETGLDDVRGGLEVAVDRHLQRGRDLEVRRRLRPPLAKPASRCSPQICSKASTLKKIGIQPSQISAAISTDLRPIAPTKTGIRLRSGWKLSFSALPSPPASGSV